MVEKILLVNEHDAEVGFDEKMKVHKQGHLHRAFSIFIFNSLGQTLLQKRAVVKYHCGGLWTNTCCSHQRKGETLKQAVHRRLKEELGFDTKLNESFTFTYYAKFDNGLTENELDHVFLGQYNGEVHIDLNEIEEYKWISLDDLKDDISKNPETYTPWLKIIFSNYSKYLLAYTKDKKVGLN
ncbi:isopentenyl-diphosphate Delta-isomerase [Patescibacteria group bacterium]|nr:isopentenyl-diphosphate Delta-isomerase [Patescibacteria group bacterium]